MLELGPAVEEVVRVVGAVEDAQLGAPSPCGGTSVGMLLDHLQTLSEAFTRAARKESAGSQPPPTPDVANLDADWRVELPRRLRALAEAWRDPAAWEGKTDAGGLVMDAEQAGVVALDEVVLHGWDLARAIGAPYEVDDASAAAVLGFAEFTARPENAGLRTGLFGPVVAVPAAAPLFDRALGYAGRDPQWTV